MLFKSRNEAFTYAIWRISELKLAPHTQAELDIIDRCLNKLRTLLDRHEQDPYIMPKLLNFLKQGLSSILDQQTLETIQDIYSKSDFKQTPQQQFENPLARRLESELGIELVLHPTAAMMEAVGRVSQEIIKVLDDMDEHDQLQQRLDYFKESFHTLSFGSFKTTPTVDELFEILENNDPSKLIQIMFIHFRFGQYFLPFEPIFDAPEREPIGELKNIIGKLYLHSQKSGFFKTKLLRRIPRPTEETQASEFPTDNPRTYIANEKFYKSPLYTALRDRGRDGPVESLLTQQMGLMLLSQADHEDKLPIHDSAWTADCKFQKADLSSQYVLDLIQNDAVYVAGPSGMTGVLLGQMEIMANFETMALKQNYLSAVVAYMLSGGYHSLHEVIGPAEYVLKLVPGYKVQVPETGVLSPAPNFDQFFHQQTYSDPEFNSRYESAYKAYLHYFDYVYIAERMPLEKVKMAIIEKLDNYLLSLKLNLSTRHFLTKTDVKSVKAQIVFKYRYMLGMQTDFKKLQALLGKMQDENELISQTKSPRFFLAIDDQLETCIEEIESLCESYAHILQDCYPQPGNT